MDFSKEDENLRNILENNVNFLLFTHAFPDGDAIGSVVALYKFLKKNKKNVFIICNSEIPYQYSFMAETKNILKSLEGIVGNNEYIAIFADCADIGRTRIDFNFIKKSSKIIINIDHHLSNTYFGDLNIVFPEKSATCEIIYNIFKKYFPKDIDRDIAEALYTGILTDTGKFQYSNTTKTVHKIISDLIEYNINPSRIYNSIYENEPANRFRLLAIVFKRTKMLQGNNLIYSYIKMRDLDKLKLPFSSNDGIIELLRTAKNIKVAALFKEVKKNKYKVSLRSADDSVNVALIAEKFGGGGHKMASAYAVTGNLKKNIKKLNELIRINL